MLVPQTRLLFWFAAIAVPFSTLGAVYPPALLLSLCVILTALAVALLDAGRSSRMLECVRLELPKLIRLTRDRPAILPVTVRYGPGQPRCLRIGLVFPPELNPAVDERLVLLPEEADAAQLDWECQPTARGRFILSQAGLEGSSPWGLWAVRRSLSVACEIRVYPNLLAARRGLAALFLKRGAFGVHAQRQLGKGREFEKLREYVPGDSYDEIHWKATARRGHPITKVFQIERTQEVYVIIDASRLSGRGCAPLEAEAAVRGETSSTRSTGRSDGDADGLSHDTVLERFLSAGLILGQAAEQQGDLFGLLTFSDQVQTFLRARTGKEHYHACRDAIYMLEPQAHAPDFDEIAAFIRTRLRRRALLVFLTSLEDPVLAEAFVRNMTLLAGQHLVLACMLRPENAAPLFGEAPVRDLDDVYRHLGGHLQWRNLRELGKVLQRRGVRFALLENEKLAMEVVAQYMAIKQRQLL